MPELPGNVMVTTGRLLWSRLAGSNEIERGDNAPRIACAGQHENRIGVNRGPATNVTTCADHIEAESPTPGTIFRAGVSTGRVGLWLSVSEPGTNATTLPPKIRCR